MGEYTNQVKFGILEFETQKQSKTQKQNFHLEI